MLNGSMTKEISMYNIQLLYSQPRATDDLREYQRQLMGFLQQFIMSVLLFFREAFQHPKPVLTFFGFFAANANSVCEIFTSKRIVRFTVISTNTAARSDQLLNINFANIGFGETFAVFKYRFSKLRSPLLQVKLFISVQILHKLFSLIH